MEPRARDDLVGEVIDGRFELRAKLGQGGMGTVYRAWQRSIGREVALKLIDRSLTNDPMSVVRFEREAQLASRLSQPNTVAVIDSGRTADGRMFLVMELIRGRTLAKVLHADGRFSLERVVRIGVQLCDALEAAHALGIMHRDLKLENVSVLDEPPGRDLVKVLDFGLAKHIGDLGGTAAGIVVGTPRYIAPEAATRGTMVPAGDLYAVGVMLAELAIGGLLWDGRSLAEVLVHQLDPGPAIARVPAPLQAVVRALLDPAPERRPTAAQTRDLLIATLERDAARTATLDLPAASATVPVRVVSRPPIPAPRGPSSRLVWLIAGSVGALVAGIVIAAVALRSHEPAGEPARDHTGGDRAPSTAMRDEAHADAAQSPIDPPGAPAGRPDAGNGSAAATGSAAVPHTGSLDWITGTRPGSGGGRPPSPARLPADIRVVRLERGSDGARIVTSCGTCSKDAGQDITILVESTPAGAEIQLMGLAAGKAPLAVVTSASKTAVEIDGTLGDQTKHRSVVPDAFHVVDMAFLRAAPDCHDKLVEPANVVCQRQWCSAHPNDLKCGTD